MIGLFASRATASWVAKHRTTKLSHLFEELLGTNLEFELITPKPFKGTYIETNLSRFGFVGLSMTAILYIKMFTS